MTEERRGRGRPKGSEIDDGKMLSAIADMLIANSRLRATTAMRRIERNASEAEIHRWQDKWKQRKDGLLADAAARAEAERCRKAKQEAMQATRLSGADIITLTARIPNVHSIGLKAYIENSSAFRLRRQIEQSSVFQLSARLREKVERIAAVQQRALLGASPAIKKWEAQSRLLKARFPTLYL